MRRLVVGGGINPREICGPSQVRGNPFRGGMDNTAPPGPSGTNRRGIASPSRPPGFRDSRPTGSNNKSKGRDNTVFRPPPRNPPDRSDRKGKGKGRPLVKREEPGPSTVPGTTAKRIYISGLVIALTCAVALVLKYVFFRRHEVRRERRWPVKGVDMVQIEF